MTNTTGATAPPAVDEVLSIGAAAAAAGASIDTVRYYDRCGLLDDLARDPSGNRRFTAADVGWIRVLRCLRATGMSIEELRRFCAHDAQAEPEQRLRLLEAHRDAVRERIARTEQELAVVETKIAAYRAVVEGRAAAVRVEGAP